MTSDTLPFVGAVGYISDTEEFLIGYLMSEYDLTARAHITIPSGDYVRPGGLSVYKRQAFWESPIIWMIGQRSVR